MAAAWRSGWSEVNPHLRILEVQPAMSITSVQLEERGELRVVRLRSGDGTNRLTRDCIPSLTEMVSQLAREQRPIILAGSDRFFSAGAELEEICALNGRSAYDFSRLGQTLMNAIDCFPAPVCAAISGYCMGGGDRTPFSVPNRELVFGVC